MRIKYLSICTLIIIIALICANCTYLKNRGNDACDILDIGITVTDKWQPDFALYVDLFSVLSVGVSSIDGKFLGWSNRQIGWLDYTDKSWALLVWGSEKEGAGEFNPHDPHQVRADQSDLTERPKFNTGIVRIIAEDNAPPPFKFFECDKVVHIGWIGIQAPCRPLEIVDFILGWTTLDIMGDDNINKGK
jgi:hypothetical protein